MEKTEDKKKKWIKIYPSYIDKALKHSEGRKVAINYAVENPNIREIFGVCSTILSLECKEEIVFILIN